MAKKTEGRVVVRDFEVTVGDNVIRVPVDKHENRIADMVGAAQLRAMIQAQMKRWQDAETDASPKELRDLAEALAKLAEFSGKVYEGGEDEPDDTPNDEGPASGPNFAKIIELNPKEPA